MGKVDRNELWHNYRRRRKVNGRLTSPPLHAIVVKSLLLELEKEYKKRKKPNMKQKAETVKQDDEFYNKMC